MLLYFATLNTKNCGHTFDRENIRKWFEADKSCPICRKYVQNDANLTTNFTLKSLIDRTSGLAGVAELKQEVDTTIKVDKKFLDNISASYSK